MPQVPRLALLVGMKVGKGGLCPRWGAHLSRLRASARYFIGCHYHNMLCIHTKESVTKNGGRQFWAVLKTTAKVGVPYAPIKSATLMWAGREWINRFTAPPKSLSRHNFPTSLFPTSLSTDYSRASDGHHNSVSWRWIKTNQARNISTMPIDKKPRDIINILADD